MKRLLALAGAALMAFTLFVPSAGAASALTRADLSAAVLSPADLDDSFTVTHNQPFAADSDFATWSTVMRRDVPGNRVVGVVLIDADFGTPAQLTDAMVGALKEKGVTTTAAAPPALGEDTVRVTFHGDMLGEAIAFREGSVVAFVMVLGADRPSALPYAGAQQAKLAVALT